MTEEINNGAAPNEPATPSEPTGKQGAGDAPKTFTQAQFEYELGQRLARERDKYKDYADLKKKAGNWDEHEKNQLTEQQKLDQAREAEKARADKLEAALITERTRTAVHTAAGNQKVPADRLDDVYALLDKSTLKIEDDGTVKGVAEAVAALLKAKPYLLLSDDKGKGKGSTSPGNPAGGEQPPSSSRIRDRRHGTGETFSRGGIVQSEE